EGIVKAIGSAHDHKEVLANPNTITQTVLHSSLDSQTAFEIVSVDMADIEVGENIGAKLQADQAAADLRVAQAEAEKRRAMAGGRPATSTDSCRKSTDSSGSRPRSGPRRRGRNRRRSCGPSRRSKCRASGRWSGRCGSSRWR